MAKFNATALKFYVETGQPATFALISEQTTGSLTRSRDQIDTTSKDHDGYASFIGGLRSGDAAFEIIVDHAPGAGKVNYLQLVDLYDEDGDGIHTFRIDGDGRRVTFKAMITDLEKTMDMEDTAKCSISLQVSGKPIESTIA